MNRAIRLTEPIEEPAIWLPIKIMKCASPELCWSRSALDRVSGKVVGNQSSSRLDPECHKLHWLVRVMLRSPPTRTIFYRRVRWDVSVRSCAASQGTSSWDWISDLTYDFFDFLSSPVYSFLCYILRNILMHMDKKVIPPSGQQPNPRLNKLIKPAWM